MKKYFLVLSLCLLAACKSEKLPEQPTVNRDSLEKARKNDEMLAAQPSRLVVEGTRSTVLVRNTASDIDSLFRLPDALKHRKPEQLLREYLAFPPRFAIAPHILDPTNVKKIVETDTSVVFEYTAKQTKVESMANFQKVRRAGDSVWILTRVDYSVPK